MSRYPASLRRALRKFALEDNIGAPRGVYTRPWISVAPFYLPYGVQFVWDLPYSGYAVLRLFDDGPELVRGFVENMLEVGAIDDPMDRGMLARSVTFEGDQAGQVGSQTPMLCWLTRQVHEQAPDDAFLRRVYPALAANVDWWQSPRRDHDGDGLSEYAGTTTTYCVYESGHDYSPERDLVMGEQAEPGPDGLVHEPIADVNLNSCLYAELDALAVIAAIVDPDRVPEWEQRRDALGARMREAMWDEEVGAFFPVVRRDLCPDQPRYYRHTPAMLQPLWAGIATPEQAERTLRLLKQYPRDYPSTDARMTVRLDPSLYHGYQVVTDALHPSRGDGEAAGGIELTDDGFVAHFLHDRGPATAAFRRIVVTVEVADVGPDPYVDVAVTDGKGVTQHPVAGKPELDGTVQGTLGIDPFAVSAEPTWTPGLAEIRASARDCRITSVHVDYSRMDRAGLLSAYGLKSAHPLDGKHPAPGAPTDLVSGTVWGQDNLHGVWALQRYGHDALAEAMARAFCDAVALAYAAGGDSFEHNSHENGRGLGCTGYTWSGCAALVLMHDVLDPAESRE